MSEEQHEELPVYDENDAVRYVMARTSYSEEHVALILKAQTIYLAALGAFPAETVPGVNLSAVIRAYSDLFPEDLRASGCSRWDLEAEFASQHTELPWRWVLEVLLGASNYEYSIGVINEEALREHEHYVADELHLMGHSADDVTKLVYAKRLPSNRQNRRVRHDN